MKPSLLLSGLWFGATVLLAAPPQTGANFFKDMAETRDYRNGRPSQGCLTPDGRTALFLRSGPRDTTLHLLAMDLETGGTTEVISPETLLKGASEHLSPEEKARRERQRELRRGFTSFQLSRDGQWLLLPLSGHLYVVRRSTGAVLALPGQDWLDPKFSPDGRKVAAVRRSG